LASRAIFIHSLDNVKRLPMVIYYFGVVILWVRQEQLAASIE
jgi:hypothetical protein